MPVSFGEDAPLGDNFPLTPPCLSETNAETAPLFRSHFQSLRAADSFLVKIKALPSGDTLRRCSDVPSRARIRFEGWSCTRNAATREDERTTIRGPKREIFVASYLRDALRRTGRDIANPDITVIHFAVAG
jgi:hypothetical protein